MYAGSLAVSKEAHWASSFLPQTTALSFLLRVKTSTWQLPMTVSVRLEAAVMVHLPSATAVTVPFSSAAATVSSLLDQVTLLSFTESGSTLAVRRWDSPGRSFSAAGETVTLSAVSAAPWPRKSR